MLQVLEIAHGDGDAVSDLFSPSETSRNLRHVLVDRSPALRFLGGHLSIVHGLGVVELLVHHVHDHRVLGLKVLLDHLPLQQTAHDVNQLEREKK